MAQPSPAPYPPATAPPDRMIVSDRIRLRAAAFHATRVFPGPVGEVLARELWAWEEFGYRLGDRSLIWALVVEIENRPLPKGV